MKISLKTRLLLVLVPMLFSAIAEAEIKTVVWATPDWEGLTSSTGGLFIERDRAAFKSVGVDVNVVYVPWKRAYKMVQTGEADMLGGVDKSSDFYQSSYISTRIREGVLVKNEFDWDGLNSLKGKRGVWTIGYVDFIEDQEVVDAISSQFTEVSNGSSALKMLNANRADFYFGNFGDFEITLGEMSGSINESDFMMFPIIDIPLYMSFTRSEKGKEVKALYDQGIENLKATGELEAIYQKWNEDFVE
jgi:ABC-type amino acid transport substrate-binding protein